MSFVGRGARASSGGRAAHTARVSLDRLPAHGAQPSCCLTWAHDAAASQSLFRPGSAALRGRRRPARSPRRADTAAAAGTRLPTTAARQRPGAIPLRGRAARRPGHRHPHVPAVTAQAQHRLRSEAVLPRVGECRTCCWHRSKQQAGQWRSCLRPSALLHTSQHHSLPTHTHGRFPPPSSSGSRTPPPLPRPLPGATPARCGRHSDPAAGGCLTVRSCCSAQTHRAGRRCGRSTRSRCVVALCCAVSACWLCCACLLPKAPCLCAHVCPARPALAT
jgi:hypothetical protein